MRQSLQLIDSAKRYAQGDVDEFVSALNDCADFNNVSARIVANVRCGTYPWQKRPADGT